MKPNVKAVGFGALPTAVKVAFVWTNVVAHVIVSVCCFGSAVARHVCSFESPLCFLTLDLFFLRIDVAQRELPEGFCEKLVRVISEH